MRNNTQDYDDDNNHHQPPPNTHRLRMLSQLERVEHRPSRQCPNLMCSSTLQPNPNPECASVGASSTFGGGFMYASLERRESPLTLNENDGPVFPMVLPTLYLGPGAHDFGSGLRTDCANTMLGVAPWMRGCQAGAYLGPGLSVSNCLAEDAPAIWNAGMLRDLPSGCLPNDDGSRYEPGPTFGLNVMFSAFSSSARPVVDSRPPERKVAHSTQKAWRHMVMVR